MFATRYDLSEYARTKAIELLNSPILPSCNGTTQSLSENRLGEGDSPILLRRLRKIGTVPGGSRIGSLFQSGFGGR
jgi:hypothetical protein